MNSHGGAALQSQIIAALRSVADPTQVAPMRAYMLEQFDFLGVRAPVRRQALRGIMSLKGWAAGDLLALADALWDLPEREYQYVGVDLLATYQRQLGLADLHHLLQLVQRRSWWDTVDGLAGVVGDLLQRERAKHGDVQRLMDACLDHANLWVRRVAMLHQLGWKEQTDERRLLHYARNLAPETDFFIRKAIGWALRDYARTRSDVVRQFLITHARQLSGLTRREAGKHLNLKYPA